MPEKITVPTLGESVTEATVSKWLKSQGEKVVADEPIVELETDKVNVEVPAPSNGVLGNIKVQEGETVNVGSLLGTINDSASDDIVQTKEVKSYNPPKKQSKPTESKKNNIKLYAQGFLVWNDYTFFQFSLCCYKVNIGNYYLDSGTYQKCIGL